MNGSPKHAAEEFLHLCSKGEVREAWRRYVGESFRHHNAYFPGDGASLMSAMEDNATRYPDRQLEIQRSLQDGDLVAVHSRVTMRPGEASMALVHIFRFADGRIEELWDVGQEAPPESPNQHGMF